MNRKAVTILCCGAATVFAGVAVCIPADATSAVRLRKTTYDDGRIEDSRQPRQLDPAGWGSDHVGKPIPEFITGDECLFCHRMDVGPTWGENRHHLTVRPAGSAPQALAALRGSPAARKYSPDVTLVLGDKRRLRYLKQTNRYGQLAMLTAAFSPSADGKTGSLIESRQIRWDTNAFGKSCAGCHATAVDAKTQAFTEVSLDCFTCHGDVLLEHSKAPGRALFSKKKDQPARITVSICGQCHIRTGKSRSTGRPHADNFIAGDNLFRDLKVDWSDAHLDSLGPADRHILENVRDVVILGRSKVTCLSCHEVHAQTSRKHRELDESDICANCHKPGDYTQRREYEVHSRTCGY